MTCLRCCAEPEYRMNVRDFSYVCSVCGHKFTLEQLRKSRDALPQEILSGQTYQKRILCNRNAARCCE